MPLLKDGQHLIMLRGARVVRNALLPTLAKLRHDSRSHEIAAAAGAFARTWLSHS